jgi:hypothetical protein
MAAAAVETPLMTSRVAALHRLPEHVQVVALTPIAPPPLQPLFVATRLQPRETEFTDPTRNKNRQRVHADYNFATFVSDTR